MRGMHRVQHLGLFVCPLLLLLAFHARSAETPPTPPVEPPKQTDEEIAVGPLTEELIKQIQKEDPGNIWEPVNRLVRLGKSHGAAVTARLETELASPDEKTRLAVARVLCQLGVTERAAGVLAKIIESGATAELRRLAANAVGLTTTLYGEENISKTLAAMLKLEKDELTRVSIARSLWRITSGTEGRDELLRLLNNAAEKNVKDEVALVLAESGLLHMTEVRLRLLNLYTEPTAQGERAFNLLRRYEEDGSRTRESKLVMGEQLLREILRDIKSAYPDETKYDLDALFESAAKGMVSGLDQFSQYMDRDEVKATQEMLQQDYSGIGAYVGLRNGQFIVTSPIYGSPADRAGLRAMDIVQEVDGLKTSDLLQKGGMNGVISKLKGPPGTPVKVKYFRRGFAKGVEVTILREKIRVESVFHVMLPGAIGYVRLVRFGERSSEEMQAALDDLLTKQKARALIFDMRDNPGGLLRAGVDIADKFLADKKLIVYSEGNKEFSPRRDYFASGGPEEEAYPLVVLVGAGSASASEIVAGALQDHKRAVLVGEKTYGKGSVQQIMPLRTTEKQTQLRLTIAKYYLPSGRCIHEKGVDVDVEIKLPETHSWVIEKLAELRRKAVFEDYVRGTWEKNKELCMQLAISDGGKCEIWPGFEEFYQKLHTQVERPDIRAEVRAIARRMVQDEQKHELVVDLQEDDILQRGVLEALKKLGVDPAAIAEYKGLPEKFKKREEEAREGAMLPDGGGRN